MIARTYFQEGLKAFQDMKAEPSILKVKTLLEALAP
jgi:hypothetical protein